jgi:hypothetical protein
MLGKFIFKFAKAGGGGENTGSFMLCLFSHLSSAGPQWISQFLYYFWKRVLLSHSTVLGDLPYHQNQLGSGQFRSTELLVE